MLSHLLATSASKSEDPLRTYTDRALARVWKAQHLSYWMTMMLHRLLDATDFDVRPPGG